MRPPLARGFVAVASLCCVLSTLGCLVACAGAPARAPTQAPAAASPSGSGSGIAATGQQNAAPAGGNSTSVGNTSSVSSSGTAIQDTAPPAMTKAQAERKAIEEALVYGSPSAFSRGFDLIASSTLAPADARLLAWVGARMATIAYPVQAPSFVPQDLRNQGAIPSGSLARMISEALSGRVSQVQGPDAGDPLAELIPSFAAFRSDSRETARLALAALDRFGATGASSAMPSIIRGLDAERRSAPEESLGYYRKALALAPDAWPAILGAARDLLALQRPGEALDLLSTVPAGILADRDFRKLRAEALYESGSFDEAGPLVAQALADDPLDAHMMLLRAHLLVRAKQYQQAIPLLDAYSTVDDSNRTLVMLRGLVAEGLHNREEGLRWARKGLEKQPDDPEFLELAARLLMAPPAQPATADERSRDFAEARSDAKRAFDLTADGNPDPPGQSPGRLASRKEAGRDAARLLLEDAANRYDWASAAQYLDRAQKAPGFSNQALVALVLRKSGDWSKALDQATLWYQSDPKSEAAAEAYLRALIGSGNTKAAEDLLPRLLLSPGTTIGRSNLHFLQSVLAKNEESALSALRTSLVENADNVESLLGVYDIYYRRQDWQRAGFYLKQALALSPRDPEIIQRTRELAAAAPSAAPQVPAQPSPGSDTAPAGP